MTRFTEEGFSSLISFIFISDAIKKMTSTFDYYPIDRDFKPDYITTYRCDCLPPDQGESEALGQSECFILQPCSGFYYGLFLIVQMFYVDFNGVFLLLTLDWMGCVMKWVSDKWTSVLFNDIFANIQTYYVCFLL